MKAKTYHYADKIDSQGGVSALCYAIPRRIDLKRALWTIRPDAVTCPKCRALLASKAPQCAVRGLIRPGAMCGAVIVGGELCGFKGKCEHQRTSGVPAVPAPAAPVATLRVTQTEGGLGYDVWLGDGMWSVTKPGDYPLAVASGVSASDGKTQEAPLLRQAKEALEAGLRQFVPDSSPVRTQEQQDAAAQMRAAIAALSAALGEQP